MMKRLFVIGCILALSVGGCAAVKHEEVKRVMAVQSLFAPDEIVRNFSNMGDAFLTTPIPRGDAPIIPFPEDIQPLSDTLQAYAEARNLTGLLVLKDGVIVTEAYFQDTQPDDLRISWSVAKSFLSALMGVLVHEGAIASIDDPVVQYAPSLVGGAYEAATIRDVLQMSSGVVFDENYHAFFSDINRMGRTLALGGSMDGFAESLTDTYTAPGARWQYVSIDTHVIGMVIRGATGRSIADLMSEKIIGPLGFEREPTYITDGFGVAFVLGGLNITLRDYARFGQMIAQGGVWQGQQIVPEAWITESTQASAPTGTDDIGYGYQWWIPVGATPGQFLGRGVYGQYLYIDQPRNVVIVVTAGDRDFTLPGVGRSNEVMFRKIAESLGN